MHASRFWISRWASLLTIVTAIALTNSIHSPNDCSAATWADQRVAGPFVCRADFPLGDIAGLVRELAQLQNDLVQLLGVPATDEWVEIYLFHDQRTYRRYLQHYFPQVPYRRALYIKKDGPGMVLAYRSPELAVDLRHECTHALLHAVLPAVPLWLDEGLAEYMEVSPARRAFENPYLSAVRWKARLGRASRLERLEELGSLDAMGVSEYRDAWAWIHFTLHGPPEAGEELRQFLANLCAHAPAGMLSGRLERRLPGTQHRFVAHFRGWKR